MEDKLAVKSMDVAGSLGLGVDNDLLSAEVLHALETLSTGTIPREAVKEHPGKGGKTFKYVSHIWVTQQLRRAFGQLWSMRVQSYQVFADGAVALVTLVLKMPTGSVHGMPTFLENEITEVGAFDGGGGKMGAPMMIASAVSRGLVKCVMRRFGVGEEFYGADEFEITAAEAWDRLSSAFLKEGLTKEKILEVLKLIDINRDNIVERYLEAWKAVYTEAHKKEVPEAL
jgi:hypothetical protein